MTPSELRQAVRDLLSLPVNYPRLTDALIDSFLNEAFVLLAERAVPARVVSSVNLVLASGTSQYAVTGAPLRVMGVNISGAALTPTTLQALEQTNPGWQSESGTPQRYFVEGADSFGAIYIRLHPTPSSAGSARVSILSKPAHVATFGDSEVSTWSPLAQHAAVYYAAWRHGSRASELVDAGKLQVWKQTFDEFVETLRRNEDPMSVYKQQTEAQQR